MGFFRLVLALLVVVTHIFYPYWFGHYAVFGFYIISGYLMTFVVHTSYGYSLFGFLRFILNRVLRIYPLYIIFSLFSIVVLFFVGEESRSFNVAMGIPNNFLEVFQNFIILGMPNDYSTRVIPPAWALSVELFFYILIGFGISKSKFITVVWFMVSILISLYMIIADFGFSERYFTVWAASLPFSIGGLLFYYRDYFKTLSDMIRWQYVFFAFVYVFFSPTLILALEKESLLYFFIDPHGVVMYANIFLMSILLVKISVFDFVNGSILGKFNKLMGDMSYPVYLSHWLVGLVLSILIFGEANRPSLLLLICVIPSCIILSYFFLYFDRIFDVYRDGIRRR